MFIFNTMTSSKEEFKPINGKRVKMFVCGITPYDSPHMGNLRTFIFFDVVAKYLRSSGYEVFYLQNITERKLSAHFNVSIPLSASSWDKLVSFSTTFSAMSSIDLKAPLVLKSSSMDSFMPSLYC